MCWRSRAHTNAHAFEQSHPLYYPNHYTDADRYCHAHNHTHANVNPQANSNTQFWTITLDSPAARSMSGQPILKWNSTVVERGSTWGHRYKAREPVVLQQLGLHRPHQRHPVGHLRRQNLINLTARMLVVNPEAISRKLEKERIAFEPCVLDL